MKFYTIMPDGKVVPAVKALKRFSPSMLHTYQLYATDLMGEIIQIDPPIPVGIGTEVQRMEPPAVEILSYSSQSGACIVMLFDPSGEGPEPKVTMPGRWAMLSSCVFSRHTSRRLAESWVLGRGGILAVDDHYYEVDSFDNLQKTTKEDCVYRLVVSKKAGEP